MSVVISIVYPTASFEELRLYARVARGPSAGGATGFATSAFMLLALRAAMGVSESLFMPSALALTATSAPPVRDVYAISFSGGE